MITFKYTIQDKLGIHARPAGMIVKIAKEFTSKITITREEKCVDLTKLLALMGLGAKHGSEVVISVDGEDEIEAAATIEQFFKDNL